MDYAYQITSIVKNLAIVAACAMGFTYLKDAHEDGRQLKVIVVEQRRLFDRLRGDFDAFKNKADTERDGLLKRLLDLERKRGESGQD